MNTELEGRYGLKLADFSRLLKFESEEAAAPLFERFDSDKNGLVDAFEVISVLAMAAEMNREDRVKGAGVGVGGVGGGDRRASACAHRPRCDALWDACRGCYGVGTSLRQKSACGASMMVWCAVGLSLAVLHGL